MGTPLVIHRAGGIKSDKKWNKVFEIYGTLSTFSFEVLDKRRW